MVNGYPINNFYQILIDNARISPKKTALYDEDRKISNLEFKYQVDQVAEYLIDEGIKRGDRIAIVVANSSEFIIIFFATCKIGAIAVPINNFLKHDELAYILNDCGARFVFASAKFAEEIKDLTIASSVERIIWLGPPLLQNEVNHDYSQISKRTASSDISRANSEGQLDDLAVIIYTSGTTGKPKGAMLSYRNFLSIVYGAIDHYNIKSGKARFICYLPMFHAFTLAVTILLPIITNSGVVIVRSIATKGDFKNLLKLLLLHRCQYFAGVPDIFNAMARAKLPWYFHWFHNVKGFVSGAAPLSSEVIQRFTNSFKRGKLVQGYGLSECASGVALNKPWANKDGSVGTPLKGFQIETFDDNNQIKARGEIGEIAIKGDCVMLGYYNRPVETLEVIHNGWFRTGDIGYVDNDGFVFIIDRKKDLIISKGMNIYPREIEEFLYSHNKVQACAVIGAQDKDGNEVPLAYIELKDNESATEAEFKAFLRPLLAPFKQPKKVVFIDKLPRNATGKILKRELKQKIFQ